MRKTCVLRIVDSAPAIVVRADLFLNRPECVGSAWAVHIPVVQMCLVKCCCGTVGVITNITISRGFNTY